jgi:hypothetical protein
MTATKDPTPEEIAQRCAEIQRGWSEQEKLKRLRSDLRPTFTRCDGEVETMTTESYNGHHDRRAELQAMAGG